MATAQGNSTQQFEEQLQRLVDFEPTTLPVISLYLNTQADEHGRDHFEGFLRREFASRARTFAAGSLEAESFARDTARIQEYIEKELKASANGLAIFACAGTGEFFEALQLNAPVDQSRLYVAGQPHLYHLARLDDEYPRYAALVTDANSARIFVFGLGEKLADEKVKSKKVQRVKVGGWSQARYQRRVENAHKEHVREAIDALGRIVKEEGIRQVVIAGDASIAPLVEEELPKELKDKLVDSVRLDAKAPEHEVFEATLSAIREQDAVNDAEKVKRLFEQFRAGGLAVVGSQDTLEALTNGQVEEVLIGVAPEDEGQADLVTKAKQTGAEVSFIEDRELLAGVDGVGAFLRWRA